MDNDIRFYDFSFNLLYILPPFSPNGGYGAVNTSIELCGAGTLEVTFRDDELRKIVTENRDNIMVVWHGYAWYITGFMLTDTTYKLFGKHLNGLLGWCVTRPFTKKAIPQTAGYYIYSYVLPLIPWLDAADELYKVGNEIEYGLENYTSSEAVVKEICELAKCGYEITADFARKKFVFSLIERRENKLMLSVGNLNIYEPEVTYDSTAAAVGGWYKSNETDPEEWKYITSDSEKTGISRIDTVLSATSEDEAKKELAKCAAKYEIAAKTKSLIFGTDYHLGDIVRIQSDGVVEKKLISGVSLWNEQSYGEEPILCEIEEAE